MATTTPTRYNVHVRGTITRDLTWEDALFLYRTELALAEADYAARIAEVVSVVLTEGCRVIAVVCYSVAHGPALDSRLPQHPYLAKL